MNTIFHSAKWRSLLFDKTDQLFEKRKKKKKNVSSFWSSVGFKIGAVTRFPPFFGNLLFFFFFFFLGDGRGQQENT